MNQGNQKPLHSLTIFAAGDPDDIKLWSGTPHHMTAALRKYFEVVHVEQQPFVPLFRLIAKVLLKATNHRIDLRLIPLCVRLASVFSRRRIEKAQSDFVLSIASSGLASMISKSKRQILISDATSLAIVDYYKNIQNLSSAVKRGYVEMEAEALSRAEIITYPSQWAADSAIKDFGVKPSKVRVLPWGPNFVKPADVSPRRLEGGTFRLLFIGVEWSRKGGEIALETMRLLNTIGKGFHLDIVGVGPSAATTEIPENVTFYGRLSKADPEQAKLFKDLFERAHLFFLPTKAEALGMVFAEAACLALPSLSYATGGVTTVVKDGETGILLSERAGPAEFANTIQEISNDQERYFMLSDNALSDSSKRLDWDEWAKSLHHVIDEISA